MTVSDPPRATFVRRCLRQPATIAGLVPLILVVLFSVAGMAFWKHSWRSLDFPRYAEPSLDHPFGTDRLGRDMVAQVSRGVWNSMPIAIVVAVLAGIAGVMIGALAHQLRRGGRPAVARLVDVLLVGLAVAVIVLFERGFHLPATVSPQPGSPDGRVLRLPFRLADVDWQWLAPILVLIVGTLVVRGLLRHAVPATPDLIAILVGLAVAFALAYEWSLRDVVFGFALRMPEPSLDQMWSDNRNELDARPWLSLVPATLLALIPFAVFLVGAGVGDAANAATTRRSNQAG